jgi:hypothetical protein
MSYQDFLAFMQEEFDEFVTQTKIQHRPRSSDGSIKNQPTPLARSEEKAVTSHPAEPLKQENAG